MISRRRLTGSITAAVAGASVLHGAGEATAHTGASSPGPAARGLGPVRRVRTDVLEIAHHDVGPAHGTPMVLLHGWPFDPVGSYAEVVAELAPRGYRCYVPYPRGHGGTRFLEAGSPRSGQQAALGADLVAFMDALRVPRAPDTTCPRRSPEPSPRRWPRPTAWGDRPARRRRPRQTRVPSGGTWLRGSRRCVGASARGRVGYV